MHSFRPHANTKVPDVKQYLIMAPAVTKKHLHPAARESFCDLDGHLEPQREWARIVEGYKLVQARRACLLPPERQRIESDEFEQLLSDQARGREPPAATRRLHSRLLR
jgi:hypothetical protein